MFKVGHYYKVTHNATCIIKVIRHDYGDDLWKVQVIKILEPASMYTKNIEGSMLDWYESWCTNVKEIRSKSKLLAMIL